MDNEKITIIVTAYNSEKYIERCINSILDQTYKNIQIIVINDGSEDSTGKILDRFVNKIKVYEKKNEGVSNARNYGIEKCETPYFMFVDSDDYLEPQAVSILYENLKKSNSDIAMGRVDEEKDNIILEKDKYDYLFETKVNYFMVPWNKLYKTEIFENLKYPDMILAEDEYLIHHILKKIKKMIIVKEKTYNYSLNSNGLTSQKLKNYRDIINAFKNRYEFFKNTKYETKAHIQYLNYYINFYCKYRSENIKKEDLVLEFKDNLKKLKKMKISIKLKFLLFGFSDELYYRLWKVRSKLCK